jgi:hypothetical protein
VEQFAGNRASTIAEVRRICERSRHSGHQVVGVAYDFGCASEQADLVEADPGGLDEPRAIQ